MFFMTEEIQVSVGILETTDQVRFVGKIGLELDLKMINEEPSLYELGRSSKLEASSRP